MDKGLIPRRYAKALYEVALERHDADKLYHIMLRLADAFANADSMAQTLANPYVSDADKISILTAAAGAPAGAEDGNTTETGDADTTYADFLKLLAQNKRLDMARDIALAYIAIYRRANAIYKVSVVSAAPLGDAEKARLEAVIAKHVGKGTMEYDFSVDPALIGGFTVTINSERLDASVASQLKELKLAMGR